MIMMKSRVNRKVSKQQKSVITYDELTYMFGLCVLASIKLAVLYNVLMCTNKRVSEWHLTSLIIIFRTVDVHIHRTIYFKHKEKLMKNSFIF